MPNNGSKNDKMAPRTTRRCLHERPRVVGFLRSFISSPVWTPFPGRRKFTVWRHKSNEGSPFGRSSMGKTCGNTDCTQGVAPHTEQVQTAKGSSPCLTRVHRPFSTSHPRISVKTFQIRGGNEPRCTKMARPNSARKPASPGTQPRWTRNVVAEDLLRVQKRAP